MRPLTPRRPAAASAAARSVLAVVAGAALVLGGLGPLPRAAAAQPVPPASGDGELDVARRDLEVAGRALADVERQVRRAGDELAATDDRLTVATTTLDGVERALLDAEDAAAEAASAERDAAAALQTASDELDDLTDRHRDGRDVLASRAVTAFKRGGGQHAQLLVAGVAGAGDWHEVAVTREVVGRALTEQRDQVAADADLTRRTARAAATVADTRRDAIDTARLASDERRRVASLAADQRRLVGAVEDELAARAATLAALEDDAAARAVLVDDLERRVADLDLAAVAVRTAPAALDLGGPPPAWAVGLPASGRTWAPTIAAVAASEGLDGRLLAAVVWSESGFRPDAVSHAGATGLAQLMPGTARGLGVDPHDPVANLTGGARYLTTQLDAFGRVDLALAAYNAGPGRVRGAGGAIPAIVETQLYVAKVLERFEALRAL